MKVLVIKIVILKVILIVIVVLTISLTVIIIIISVTLLEYLKQYKYYSNSNNNSRAGQARSFFCLQAGRVRVPGRSSFSQLKLHATDKSNVGKQKRSSAKAKTMIENIKQINKQLILRGQSSKEEECSCWPTWHCLLWVHATWIRCHLWQVGRRTLREVLVQWGERLRPGCILFCWVLAVIRSSDNHLMWKSRDLTPCDRLSCPVTWAMRR